jgi:2-polyprenyl-6-methoxyphenol hydroxylase-like FAD-dependent oxidoreductase
MLAARALVDHFGQVTIVERDISTQGEEPRKGVPQARHVHALLCKGMQIMQEFFPDLFPALLHRGSTCLDTAEEMEWYQHHVWKVKMHSGIEVYSQSRPLLEDEVRKQLATYRWVRFLNGCEAERLSLSQDHTHITGVLLRRHGDLPKEEMLLADLVIDASGRGSQTPNWLVSLGYPQVKESVVKVDVGYSTRIYRAPTPLPAWKLKLVFPTPPKETRGGSIFLLEGHKWMVTLVGWAKDYPPVDERGCLEFARSLPLPDIFEAIKDAEPLTPLAVYKFSTSRRRHYERLHRFPKGFIVLGDALASFNPTAGQGMTVAAIDARILHTFLNRQQASMARGMDWTIPCQKEIARAAELPWLLSTSEDFRYPQTQGYRMPGLSILQWYTVHAHYATRYNERVARRFWEVLHMVKHPFSLFAPDVLFSILFAKAPFTQVQRNASSPRNTNVPQQ